MKKRLKQLLVPVIALACITGGGLLTACNNNSEPEHTHSYTQWAYDEEQHWKVCSDDGAIDENSYGDHVFVAGECECGAQESGGDPSVPKEYGTATGQIYLHKLGQYVEDYTGVTIDLGDDSVTVDYDSATGEFELSDLVAGQSYTLTISKLGYNSTTAQIQVEAGKNTVLGQAASTLEYAAFTSAVGWNSPNYTYVNEEDGRIGTTSNTLAEKTNDRYDDVALTMTVDREYANNAEGLWIFFEDGNFISVAIGDSNTRIEWDGTDYYNDRWIADGENITLDATGGRNTFVDGNGNSIYYNSTPEEIIAKHEAGTLEITLVRQGARIYAFVDGGLADVITVDEQYADDSVQVGFWAKDAVFSINPQWHFRIEEDVSSYLKAVTVGLDKMTNGSATLDRSDYKIGDTVTVTFTAEEGYALQGVTLNDEDVTSVVHGGVYTFRADGTSYSVGATFGEVADPVSFSATVTVKNKDGSSDSAGKTVLLYNQAYEYTLTVADGKIEGSVAPGSYTAEIDGYYKLNITVGEAGYEGTLAFGELLLDAGTTGVADICADETVYSEGLTLTLSKNNSNSDLYQQGIFYTFSDGSWLDIRIEYRSNGFYVQFAPDNAGNSAASGGSLKGDWSSVSFTQDERSAFEAGTLKLTMVRDGNVFYIFANSRLMTTFVAPANYAEMDGTIGVAIWAASGNAVDYNYISSENVGDWVDITLVLPENMTGGTVTADKTSGKVGHEMVITVTPDEGYIITLFEINGESVLDRIEGGRYVFTTTLAGTYTIDVRFAQGALVEANIDVMSYDIYRNAETNAITSVILTGNGLEYNVQLTDGKIVGEFLSGTYTLIADGYYEVEITIGGDTPTDSVALYTLIVEEGMTGQKAIGAENVTYTEGLTITMSTAYSPEGNLYRHGFIYGFVNDAGKLDWVAIRTEFYGTSGYLQYAWDDAINAAMGGAPLKADWSKPGGSLGDFTAEEVAAFKNGTLEVTLVRDANILYIYIGSRLADTLVLDEKYAQADGTVFFWINGATNVPPVYEYLDANKIAENFNFTVTIESSENGTVTVPQMENVPIGMIELTITPAEGYACAELLINGIDVTSSIVDGKLSYVLGTDITVAATFMKAATAFEVTKVSDNTEDIQLGESVDGMDVLAYEYFKSTGENECAAETSGDPDGLLDISAAASNKNGVASDYNLDSHEWGVYDGETAGVAPCINGEFDMTIKITKDVKQIRLFVGGWWLSNHGGTFILEGEDFIKFSYQRASSQSSVNEIIVIDVDTSDWEEGEVREYTLHFNGNGYDQLPFAGIQILGETSAE